jgi:hypothetical protein
MAEDFLSTIARHLEYFGYSAPIEDAIIKVTKPDAAIFWVLPLNDGALFRALFQMAPSAAQNPADFLKFVNRANRLSLVSRFTAWPTFLSVEAWFPNCSDRRAFTSFFTRYLADISAPAQQDVEAFQRFFPPPSPGPEAK